MAALPEPQDAGSPNEDAQPDADNPPELDGATTVPSCAAGSVACDDACVDLQSDRAHCGDCETSCGEEDCVAAVCVDPVRVPEGGTAHSYREHSYFFCGDELGWSDARDACRRVQMDMSVIDDADESVFVRGAGITWLGASDIAREGGVARDPAQRVLARCRASRQLHQLGTGPTRQHGVLRGTGGSCWRMLAADQRQTR